MKISVIIICRNSLETLKSCLQSVIEQTYKPHEIIIVDGNSTDGTITYLKQFSSILVVPQLQSGIANARNLGLNQSTGEVIAFLDSDDTWPTNSLEIRVNQLKSNSKLISVGGLLLKSNEMNNPVPAYTPGGFLFKKELFNTIGYFDEKWKYASDHAWFKKMMQGNYPYELMNEIVLIKGIHSLNTSIVYKQAYRDEMMEILRSSKNTHK
jgi:glycosyltransferase involved in cell wall biosynthesis